MADELIGRIIKPAVPMNSIDMSEGIGALSLFHSRTTPGAQPAQEDRARQLFQRFQQHVQGSAWASLAKIRDEVGMPAFEALMSHAIDKKAIPDDVAYSLIGDQGWQRLAARRSTTETQTPQRNMLRNADPTYPLGNSAIPNAYRGPLIPVGEIENNSPSLPDAKDAEAWQRET